MVVAIAGAAMAACATSRATPAKPAAAVVEKRKVRLAVLAVESDKFPKVAEIATASLAKVNLEGIDEVEVSKVSLEVVQLSIECVEQTLGCYQAVGKSLAANRLLFAQIAADKPKRPKRDIRVTVTLFDVDGLMPPKSAIRVFPTEKDATAGIDTLVAEAIQ
jgi:hypothetical protein